MNEKLEKEKKTNELLELKLASQKSELVSTEIMSKVIMSCFDHLFKELDEMPYNIVKNIIDIVKTGEEPETNVIKLMAETLKELKSRGIDNSEKAMKRFYGANC